MDLKNIQPQTLNRTLSGRTLLLAARPKFGKTTFCAASPKTLILATEKGYSAQPGAYIQDISTWSDFKLALRQLADSEVKEKFDNIAVDTVGWAWDLCTQFICARAGVQTIGDIEWGRGYAERDTEFKNSLRQITMMGYGLILTCHMKERIAGEEGKEQIFLSPELDKRCLPIVNALVDIIGIGYEEWDDKKQSHRYLITRSTPTIQAGSRFKYLAPKIDFTYDAVAEAVKNAVDEEEKHGAIVVDTVDKQIEEKKSYDELMEEARELWSKLIGTDDPNNNMPRVMKKIEMIFGRPTKLSEVTEDQSDLLNLVILEMQDML